MRVSKLLLREIRIESADDRETLTIAGVILTEQRVTNTQTLWLRRDKLIAEE
jgi:hypothetical protein